MKRRRLGTYGAARHGVFINRELRSSKAYQTLTHAARLVLIDWLEAYMRKSRGDTASLTQTGMTFTYGDMTESMNYSTFKAARQAIVDRGFFTCPAAMQTIEPGARRVYVPSTEWRRYEPTTQEHERLHRAKTARRKTLERWDNYKSQAERRKRSRGKNHE